MAQAVKHIKGRAGNAHAKPRTLRHRSPIDKAKGHELDWNACAPVFEAARPVQNVSFVYLIGESDGPVKIGVSKNPIDRLRAMQTGNPRRLRLEHVLVGDIETEKLLHELWAAFAIRTPTRTAKDAPPGTEWFTTDSRDQLATIIQTAARNQVTFLNTAPGGNVHTPLNLIVRDAHAEHKHVAKGRDVVRLLGAPEPTSRIHHPPPRPVSPTPESLLPPELQQRQLDKRLRPVKGRDLAKARLIKTVIDEAPHSPEAHAEINRIVDQCAAGELAVRHAIELVLVAVTGRTQRAA